MKWRVLAGVTMLSAVAGFAAAEEMSETVTLSVVSDRSGRCLATIGGKGFDPRDQAALEAALAPYKDQNISFRIDGNTEVPYRCIGGIIYTMQRNGYNKIGFISEPEPKAQAAEH